MPNTWTNTLAEFLRREPGVNAVRINAAEHTVSVATTGEVDGGRLERHLRETLRQIETESPGGDKVPPRGFVVTEEDGTVELAAESCPTAPGFWRWRSYDWSDEPSHSEEAHDAEDWRQLAALAAVCGVFGVAGFLSARLGIGPVWLSYVLSGIALVAGGWDAAIDSWENIKRRRLDIHFLMLAVGVGAVCVGAWSEAVLLLFLFSASGAMEAYASDRTQREVGALLKSAPKQATVVLPDGRERLIDIEELGIGERVIVRPGEAFPADGVVVKGQSASDESAITGEAVPVDKKIGDSVFSGTVNQWGVVEFVVKKLPSESTLRRIIRLIETAQKMRAPSQRFTDKFGGTYTVFVLGVCAAMFLVWWLAMGIPAFVAEEGARSAFYRAMTLLVVMSPCALVLSIPSAILAAIAWGARHGILFRGGAAIERLAEVKTVAMDKTGTLTTGELSVVAYESFPVGREREVMELALAMEVNSQHPLARAITRDARARGARELDLDDFESLTGQGVRGKIDGARVLMGRRELLEKGPLADWAKRLPESPADLAEVWVFGKDLVGRVLLKDQIRAESHDVLEELRGHGIRTVMLTGDRRHTAESVARDLGVDEVRAGLTPEEKVAAIQNLRKDGRAVAMVGDGVNDAPCLAAADVGMAMGARGSDAALEQAQVILMHDRIENVLEAFRLSRRARTIIRMNLAISLGVVVVMACAAVVGGGVPLSLGVIAHEGSTVVVCLNSLRLLFGRGQG